MEKILISACLVGEEVRYDGDDNRLEANLLGRWQRQGRLVPVCPEVTGGLPVPRPPSEIIGQNHGGEAVLSGQAHLETIDGEDVTDEYLRGAYVALETAREHDVDIAILKDGSPSCGSSYIYDGSFSGTRQRDRGVTTALLEEHGIKVFNENQLEEVSRHLQSFEPNSN